MGMTETVLGVGLGIKLLSPDIEGGSKPIDFTQDGELVELNVPEVVHYLLVRLRKQA